LMEAAAGFAEKPPEIPSFKDPTPRN
jgi:hypothetical protein